MHLINSAQDKPNKKTALTAVNEFSNVLIQVNEKNGNLKELPIGRYIALELQEKLITKNINTLEQDKITVLKDESELSGKKPADIMLFFEYIIFGDIKKFGFYKNNNTLLNKNKYNVILEISVRIVRNDRFHIFNKVVIAKRESSNNNLSSFFGKNLADDILRVSGIIPAINIFSSAARLYGSIGKKPRGNIYNQNEGNPTSDSKNEQDWDNSIAASLISEATTELADLISQKIINSPRLATFHFEKISWDEYLKINKYLQNITRDSDTTATYSEQSTKIQAEINTNNLDLLITNIKISPIIKSLRLKVSASNQRSNEVYFRRMAPNESYEDNTHTPVPSTPKPIIKQPIILQKKQIKKK